jgi:hypothetical protein
MKKKKSSKKREISFFRIFYLFNRFIIETDHQTYINCLCGTNVLEQPFDNIWNILMILLNHFEEMFRVLAPSKFLYIIKRNIYSFV